MSSPVEAARAAFECEEWRQAFRGFTNIDDRAVLDSTDHERLAVAAYLLGEDDACAAAWEAAHRAALDSGDPAQAAEYAFWLALVLMLRGQMAQAGAWLNRAEGSIGETDGECAASGYVLVPQLLGALDSGDPGSASDLAVRAVEIGSRLEDPDLRALGTLGHGQALIASGETVAGRARLDEVMVSVTRGEVGPITSGLVYCAVILECMLLFDLPRASEWTKALSSWCDDQPDLVPYRGQCLVHRSQLHQAAGQWPEAFTTSEDALRRLSDPPHPALGLANYQEAELNRLVGEFDRAEACYREASRNGFPPMPGLALLELDRGDPAAAAASIKRALKETMGSLARVPLLGAAVEILRAAGDRAGAVAAADELSSAAAESPSHVLTAMASHAAGSVLMADEDPAAALIELRNAASAWQGLRMPYELARTTALIGAACVALDDMTSAGVELDNARRTLGRLGAGPTLSRVETLIEEMTGETGASISGTTGSLLSAREVEVLTLVAAGRTNREIASELVISQHTVGRHLENIFAKLGVTSRAAATAYAYEHDLF